MHQREQTRAVFLDRDGVLNRVIVRDGRPYPPRDLGELEILPGVADSVKSLKDAGFKLLVITNQPDVVRGTALKETVEEINSFLMKELDLDGFATCYHDDADNCECRKPKSGALLELAKKFSIDLNKSYMVGDRWRDIEAGAGAGCKTLFIDYGYFEEQPKSPTYIVKSFNEAAKKILGEIE